MFKTTNGGTSWTNITSNLPALPTWSIQIDSSASGRIFVGNDDGVYVTTNDGASWGRFGTGLPGAQVLQIELSAALGILGAGTHGRGLWEISLAPLVVTQAATTVAENGATLNGTVNPNGSTTTALFDYGLTTSYGSQAAASPAPGSGTSAVAVSAGVTGLNCATAYHYRAVASNASGTTNASDLTFTTSACPPPTVVTVAATSITSNGATLNGTVNPNGSDATA